MSVNGIGAAYPAWREAGKAQRNNIGTDFANMIVGKDNNEAGCFDIYNKQGERIGAFEYSDIKIRQDSMTGKQFLISEHGTMSYDAMVMDDELKEARFSLHEVDEEGNRKEDIYLIAVDKNGIRCSKMGQSEYEWEILFTDVSQYENATEFLNYAGGFSGAEVLVVHPISKATHH